MATEGGRKHRWQDLAVFGGEPAFPNHLHVGLPNLPDRAAFQEDVDQIWESRVLSNNGPFVLRLEEAFASLTGGKHAVAVCNATLGLQLVARALDLEGEVIVPSFTFIATPHAFRWEGLTPVFCDVDPERHVLDPAAVLPLIGEETVAIAGVHLWGNDCTGLSEIARDNGLHLIFDAAHSLGVARRGVFGDAEVYSLHATKIVNGFEGGMIVTDSDLLAHRLRGLRNFGFAGYDDVRGLGTNAKMSEISAAMALRSLETLDVSIETNRRNSEAYDDVFCSVPGIRRVPPADPRTSNHQYLVAEIREEELGIGRDALLKALWEEGVRVRRYFYPGCHRAEPYRWESPDAAARLPITEQLCRETLVFPTGPSVDADAIENIGEILRLCHAASRRLRESELGQAA